MKQAYKILKFRPTTLALIDTLNFIIDEYIQQGFRLTVRQLYYQMVARGNVENTERSYTQIASIVNDARLAGLMDWDAIEDRTREFIKRSRWTSPSEILRAVAAQYHEDLWEGQEHRVFVIIEKEALAGVLEKVCKANDVPLLAARGYPSGTVLREFAEQDLIPAIANIQAPVILHLGDHDPSGIDMSRDLTERLEMFADAGLEFHRIALNMDQIKQQKPPQNPAKATDSRFEEYRLKFGTSSWELDALSPTYLSALVQKHINNWILDKKAWAERVKHVEIEKSKLLNVAKKWK